MILVDFVCSALDTAYYLSQTCKTLIHNVCDSMQRKSTGGH